MPILTSESKNQPQPLPPLREIIARHGLAAKKGLGQHFLLDLNITRKIVRLAGNLDGVHVVEIGPGPGGLTRAILESEAASVTAIERDRRCIAALEELAAASAGRLRIIEGDALKTDTAALAPAPRAIIANLPYNIGTELLIGWLRNHRAYEHMTLMFQREVADRITAAPGGKTYGRLSVIAQACCKVQKLMDLPPRAFTPPPKVASSVLHFQPRPDAPDDGLLESLERVTALAFGQRRKMLKSALGETGVAALAKTGIDPTVRAEMVPVAKFLELAAALPEKTVRKASIRFTTLNLWPRYMSLLASPTVFYCRRRRKKLNSFKGDDYKSVMRAIRKDFTYSVYGAFRA